MIYEPIDAEVGSDEWMAENDRVITAMHEQRKRWRREAARFDLHVSLFWIAVFVIVLILSGGSSPHPEVFGS